MGEFEDKVRAAFDADLKRTPARPGLRQRVIANAVATPRTRPSWLRVWLTPPRMALVGAAAAVLVVAGVGLRLATQGTPAVAQHSPSPSPATLAFGTLPSPTLHPAQGLGSGGGSSAIVGYFGPANMTWSGHLPRVPKTAPVYRFAVPTVADLDGFATRIGARLRAPGSGQNPRSYAGPDGWTMFIGFDPVAGEPAFTMNRDTGPNAAHALGEAGARTAADAELATLGLTPSWKNTVSVSVLNPVGETVPLYIVQYQRVIDLGGSVTAGEVDGNGDPSGIQVVVDSKGQALRVAGVVRLAEQSASYPLVSPSGLVNDAVKAAPLQSGFGPTPSVTLTKATLVYTVVSSGDVGYLEPAYLFTGTFSQGGATLEKRVLVAALAPRSLR